MDMTDLAVGVSGYGKFGTLDNGMSDVTDEWYCGEGCCWISTTSGRTGERLEQLDWF